MDKKKVIENLKQVEFYINKLQGLDYTQLQLLKSAIFRLHDAQDELKKSDWISVEDELPPYKEDVIVCNNIKLKKAWMAYRSERDFFKKDANDFVLHGDYEPSITHWRRIDKLEE